MNRTGTILDLGFFLGVWHWEKGFGEGERWVSERQQRRPEEVIAVALADASIHGAIGFERGGAFEVNGVPIELVKPEILRLKAFEPVLLLGRQRFMGVDIRIRVRGGGKTSQIYAIRQSIAKALVAYHQKYVDEQSKKEIKDILGRYDRTLLVADPRRCEPKKFGGRGARARFQKSYR
ncbi:hypothetical protein B296_00025005 [Ensete ventricosum]|uniref:Small ribosomal subunit protein uS9 n=1 Tax=Ensete ventricosum TaxID=4639 RepID=A0A427AC49_ENSVE|nr:hypothetical protein B296_00025005 [Ensete ventricosum]